MGSNEPFDRWEGENFQDSIGEDVDEKTVSAVDDLLNLLWPICTEMS